jgi:hypothetical protein
MAGQCLQELKLLWNASSTSRSSGITTACMAGKVYRSVSWQCVQELQQLKLMQQ